MGEGDKSREELLRALEESRRRLAELESLETARTRAARMLVAAEERYNRLFDHAPAALFRATPAGELLDVNLALAQLLGYDDPALLLTHNVSDLCDGSLQLWRQAENESGDVSCHLRRHDGRSISVSARALIVHGEEGEPLYYEGSFMPAGEQGEAAGEPQPAARRLAAMRRLVEAAVRADGPGVSARLALAAVADITGCACATVTRLEPGSGEPVQWVGLSPSGSPDAAILTSPLAWDGPAAEQLRQRKAYRVDDLQRTGEWLPALRAMRDAGLRAYLSVPLRFAGRVAGALNLGARLPDAFDAIDVEAVTDVAALLALSLGLDELRERAGADRERVTQLSGRLLEVQEEERRRIAGELHDETGQLLTGLKLALEAVVPVDEAAASLESARELAAEVLAQVRDLTLDLRPSVLDDLGLVPALVWQIDRYSSRTGVQVAFKQVGADARFRPELETAAYRIVQEALTNVARHAGVSEAAVTVWVEADALSVRVEDRGRGFDVQATGRLHASGGLAGMRERAALLGGALEISSAPKGGTSVYARLPVRAALGKDSAGLLDVVD